MAQLTRSIKIQGMHCKNCEKQILGILCKESEIKDVALDWKKGSGSLTYDSEKTDIHALARKLSDMGYFISFSDTKDDDRGWKKQKGASQFIGTIFAILGLFVVVYLILEISNSIAIPDITTTMGFGLLFLVGLLTGFHCVGMCGGFVVGYTTKAATKGLSPLVSHIQYGAGKLLSYTVIGASFGLLGSFVTFTPIMRGVVGILAGAFLLVYGLSMFDAFQWTKRIRISPPAFLNRFIERQSSRHKHPAVIGLMNGLLIACGPLQAIYIIAAGTGSALEGAKFLFAFGLGTLPVMLGFGFTASLVSARSTKKIIFASGVVVMILGVIMINRGFSLMGTGLDASSLVTAGLASEIKEEGIEMKDGYQIIRMDVARYGWEPDRFVIKKGVPVRWIITGKEINSCNNAISVPEYGLNFPIRYGEQVIEFTPDRTGVISWSCWMGMIPGGFLVKDDINLVDDETLDREFTQYQTFGGGKCHINEDIGGCCSTP